MLIDKSKRIFLKLSSLGLGLFAVYKLRYFEKPIRTLAHLFDKPLPNLNSEDFFALSLDLLEEKPENLNRELADRIWNQLSTHKDSSDKILLLVSDHKQAKQAQTPLKFDEEFAAVHELALKTTLRLWYTGVFEMPGLPPERLFYEEALMHSYFYKFRPAPGNCAGGFGYWSKPPENS